MTDWRKQDTQELIAELDLSNLSLGEVQRQEILQFAREAIRDYLTLGTINPRDINIPILAQKADVFVTLWSSLAGNKQPGTKTNEKLRGCVGRIQSNTPLYVGIQESAVSAATKDPRFPPVTLLELESIRIEIAVLSAFRAINSLQEIEIGRHGLMLTGLGKRGLLLPKVAARMDLSRQSFFHAICDKAGLHYDCWPGDAILCTFMTATIEE